MSVEIRKTPDGCNFECDWGTFDNAEADPKRGIRHLVITTSEYTKQLVADGPRPHARSGVASVSVDGGRIFQHLDYNGQRWTWELFEAHFWDGEGPDVLIGRWPD